MSLTLLYFPYLGHAQLAAIPTPTTSKLANLWCRRHPPTFGFPTSAVTALLPSLLIVEEK